jgi:internalin A
MREPLYNILPEGLLPRFIVRSRALIQGPPPWRTGAVLAFEGNRAMVKADIQDRKVSIAVIDNPAGRRRLLAVIRSDFEHIHRSIARLQAEEMVPVPEHPGVVVPYTDLQTMEAEGYKELPQVIGKKVVKLDVKALLSGVEEPAARPREPVREAGAALKEAMRVVFSYAHKDEELRDQLETHLKLLQRQGVISTWHDRKIKPGDEWKGVIDESFQHADLILLLISADFVASDYSYEIEMKTALERHERSEAKVVPIILRACQWQGALFGKLQALPKDGKPVTSWLNRDEAWTDVAEGIKKTVEEIRRRRG